MVYHTCAQFAAAPQSFYVVGRYNLFGGGGGGGAKFNALAEDKRAQILRHPDVFNKFAQER